MDFGKTILIVIVGISSILLEMTRVMTTRNTLLLRRMILSFTGLTRIFFF
jgi:hypothetical protein